MPIDSVQDNQVINRQARLNLPSIGYLDLVTMAEIPRATSTGAMPTGQMRSTGQKQAADVACSVMFADRTATAKVEKLMARTDQGLPVEKGGSAQYYNEDQSTGPLIYLPEAFVHTLTYPSTDLSATGEGAQLTFQLNVRGATQVPGT